MAKVGGGEVVVGAASRLGVTQAEKLDWAKQLYAQDKIASVFPQALTYETVAKTTGFVYCESVASICEKSWFRSAIKSMRPNSGDWAARI